MSFFSFFDEEHISEKFIVPAVTVRKIHGREVYCYRVASLTAYKYLRRIILLFLVFHCIKVYNIHRLNRLSFPFSPLQSLFQSLALKIFLFGIRSFIILILHYYKVTYYNTHGAKFVKFTRLKTFCLRFP